MGDRALFNRVFEVVDSCVVRSRPYATAPIIRGAQPGETMPGHMVRGIAHKKENQWARVMLPSGVIGYIWSGYGAWK